MEYPNSHVSHVGHHRHNNNRDDDDNFAPPPPQVGSYGGGGYNSGPPPPQQHDSYGGGYNSAPPPQHESYGGGYNSAPPPQHESYGGGYNSGPSPPQEQHGSYGGGYNSGPPPPPQQQHESYGGGGYNSGAAAPPPYGGGAEAESHHRFKPHMPSFHSSHSHDQPEYQTGGPQHEGGGMGSGSGLGELESKPSSQIHCKAGGERYVFGIRDGKVLLTRPDSSDLTQQWYKDESYSTKVKDKDGHPCFMLVNKGTCQAVKHSVSCHPVQLAPYRPDILDEAVLWSESKDLGSGYRTIRTVNNIHLVMDAWNADKDHGGIHDGTVIALYETWKGDNKNQQWKFVRH